MPRVDFEKDMIIKYRGRLCKIIEKLPDESLKLKDLKTDVSINESITVLVQSFFCGDLEFVTSNSDKRQIYKNADHTLSDKDLKDEAKRKEEYVKACLAKIPNRCSGKVLEPIIAEIATKRGDAKIPSFSTVYRWRKEYIEGGMDIRALYPLHVNKGNRTPRLNPDVYAIIDQVIHTEYLNTERISIADTCERIEDKIDLDNKFRLPGQKLAYPDRSTIYRMIDDIDDYEKKAARYGKAYAKKLFEPVMQGPRPKRPLERVEIDHTSLPLFVVDDKSRMPLGRANLTSAIDVYSKCVWGFYLGFEPFSSLSLMNCFKHGIKDKSYVKLQYQNVQNTYDTYGIPENIFCDNGMDFLGKHFHDACDQLGINIEYAPVKMPWYKGSIENYFGKIAKNLLQNLPGKILTSLFDKDEYDPLKHAVISFDSLMEILHIWIIDVYHQRFHRGIQGIPTRRWREKTKEYPPTLPQQLSDLDVMLGMVEEHIVSRSGIEFLGLYYNSEKLANFRRTLDSGQKVKFKIDPTDISLVRVFTPFESFSVPAVNQEYTRSLSLWQHNVIRRLAREEAKSVDIEALHAAKRKINEIVEREFILTKKTKTRTKMARWLGIGRHAVGLGIPQTRIADEDSLLPAKGQGGGLNKVSDLGSFVPKIGNNSASIEESNPIDYLECSLQSIEEKVKNSSPHGWGSSYDLPKKVMGEEHEEY